MQLGFGEYAPKNKMGNRSMKLRRQNGQQRTKWAKWASDRNDAKEPKWVRLSF